MTNSIFFSAQETDSLIMPPVSLKAFVLSPSTMLLTWTDTSLGTRQVVSDNRFYTVRYKAVSDTGRYRYLNTTELNAHIDNLNPNTRYEFHVKVSKGSRTSTWIMKEINKTEEAREFTLRKPILWFEFHNKISQYFIISCQKMVVNLPELHDTGCLS